MKNKTVKEQQNTDSTIFCDPKQGKESSEKKRIKGLWWKIIAVVLVVFIAVPWIVVKLAGSNEATGPKPAAPLETRVKRITECGEGAEFFAAKNPDINDIDADMKLIEMLRISENCGEFTVEVSSTEKPYRLTLCFKNAHDTSMEAWFENTMVGYSCVLLALIDNADEIGWSHPDGGDGDTGGYFTRDDGEKFLGISLSRYASSEKAVQLLLNDTGATN